MKITRWLICLFYCLDFGIISGQENLIFRDPFENMTYGWSVNKDLLNTYIEDGQMQLRSELSDTPLIAYQEILLQNGADFRLSTEVWMTANEPVFEAGICWSISRERSRYYAFLVRPGGYFRVISVRDQKIDELISWTKHKKLRKIEESATGLSVTKRGWQLYFEVNGKVVGQIPYQKLMGKYQGFILMGSGGISIDHFTVYHPPLEINLSEQSLLRARKSRLDSTINQKNLHEKAPVLTEDRRTLYFLRGEKWPYASSSELWRATIQGDSIWSQANSLGEISSTLVREMLNKAGKLSLDINLPGIVRQKEYGSFYLSKDKQLLIVALDLNVGFGEKDLYIMEQDNNGKWSSPQNLGPDINTFEVEYSPFLSPDNQTLYFSSNGHPGYGGADIFVSHRTNNTWTHWSKPVNLGPKVNGPTWDDGFLPFSQRHAYMASVDSIHGDFDLYSVRIPLNLKQGETIQLENVFFHRASAEMLESSFPELDKLVYVMINNPDLEIEIRGHTDNVGFEEELLLLSEERAEAIRNYLVRKGVDASRMQFKGYGSSVPIASNNHPETRKLNRRVEFFIINR